MINLNEFYKIIGENIERERKNKKMSAEELADRIGLTKKTIRRYETGEIRIKNDRLEEISNALNVDLKTLYRGTVKPQTAKESDMTTVQIPIIGGVSCGNGCLAYEDIQGYEDIPVAWVNGDDYFLLHAKGDSMINARIHDGDLLLIKRQNDVEDGEIAAVLIDDEAVLKRVFKTETSLILQSENPTYAPIICNGNSGRTVRVLGKLKKVIITF